MLRAMLILVLLALVAIAIVEAVDDERHNRPAPICYARPHRACPVTTGAP